ncbi:MAG: hypothetical protein Q8O24_07085 [Gallionellaceae bacterium]|nr:hypothetical protein [Gallionellaceae bacterium]
MRSLHKRPTYALLLLLLLSLALSMGTAWFTLQPPWLGVQMVADGDKVRVVRVTPELARQIPEGAVVQRLVSATGESLSILPTDLIEEPDFFDTYPQMADFFSRQSALHDILSSPEVTIFWTDKNGFSGETKITPGQRPLADLPAAFWFQLIASFSGLLIAAWVFLLRRDDWGARMFALTGLMFPAFAVPAAIYSSRELAIPGETFRFLASLNHAGAFMFGCALMALFLTYPRKLIRPRNLLWLPIVFGVWLAADVFRWAPDQDWGSRIPPMLEMSLAIVFAVVQWRKSSAQPLDRAALRWFILSVVTGCGLFVFSIYGPGVLGFIPPLSQGYSFGFFLIMYAGIALGLRHFRLFDLDEWAYRIFLWLSGVIAVIVMDALLLYFGLSQNISLSATLLLCGGLYFPFRQWLWQRIVSKQVPTFDSLLPEISTITFTISSDEQQARWEALLRRIFDPLELKKSPVDKGVGEICEEGLGLLVPGCCKLSAYSLRYAGHGARLFSTRDAAFATSLSHLLEQVMSGRSSYDQGVAQERLRIGRDLHDNIGARLLKLIHHLRGTPNAEMARDAMKDLRTAIAALDVQPVPLLNALADWRAEAGGRCEAASCQLRWQQPEQLPELILSSRTKASLESVMRELITNALKHAIPSYIKVEIVSEASHLRMRVFNDGNIADPLTWKEGYGLRNLRGRMEELGGSLSIMLGAHEVQLSIACSLK